MDVAKIIFIYGSLAGLIEIPLNLCTKEIDR